MYDLYKIMNEIDDEAALRVSSKRKLSESARKSLVEKIDNNALDAFEEEVYKIAKKELVDIAQDVCSLLNSVRSEFKVYFTKANKSTDDTSMRKVFESKTSEMINDYKNAISSLKKPNSFASPVNTIVNLSTKILEDFENNSSALKKLQKYEDMMLAIDEISADKKVKLAKLKEFCDIIIRELTDSLKSFKSKGTENIFDNFD